jgi:hypothetical protein
MKAFLALPIMSISAVGLALSTAGTAHAVAGATTAHVSPFGAGSTRCGSAAGGCPALRQTSQSQASTTPVTEWVSNTAAIGNNTSCTQPKYNTISSALAAAPSGATVNVCSGTYNEALAIVKAVTLTALGSVTVQDPSTAPVAALILTPCDADGGSGAYNNDVVDICGSVAVTITGFTFQASWPSNVCYNSLYGIAVLGHATLKMSNSTVQNIGGDPQTDGCQGGVGIQVGLATSATAADRGTATLTNVKVTTYQKNGITIDGRGTTATLTSVTTKGTGATPAIAQNGIQVSDGAAATISQALVTGNECNDTSGGCGPNGLTSVQAAGILLFDAGATTVSHSNANANDVGVYNIESFAWAFYTPPAGTPPTETFSNMSLNNRYENAGFDQGVTALRGSVLRGGEDGVMALQYSGQTAPVAGVVDSNNISAASADAVVVASDQTAGDKNVSLSVTNNVLIGAVANQAPSFASSAVNATKDWWGNASGPSSWGFGSGSAVSADVNFFPWATNYARTTFETCTTGTTLTTTLNQVVLCATAGTSNAFLANNGSGKVLLLGNSGNDQLVGSSSGGETWIIGGTPGSNAINGNNGTGFIEERGDTSDTVILASGYTVAPK